MTPLPLLEQLESLPLLAQHLEHAQRLDEALMRALLAYPDAQLQRRALQRRGQILLALGHDQAPAAFADAARRAAALGDLHGELKARLYLIRALAELGSLGDAQALLPRAEREAQAEPSLALPRALARAVLQADGATAELLLALETPTPTGEAADELSALSRAAEALGDAARWSQTDTLYARAEALCARLDVPAHEVCFQRGASLIRHGHKDAALAPLRRALGSSDPRLRLAVGLLLGGLMLSMNRPQEVLEHILATQALAEHRRNWLAFSAASIDLAECLTQLGQAEAGERALMDALASCRAQGEPGALLQARLLEIRSPRREQVPEEFRVVVSEELEEGEEEV